jgi:hypothetical protein
MTLSKWQAQLETMLPMALMAYLQHLFSGAATRRNTSNYLSSNCKTICSGLDINKLTQRIDGIRIECKDLSANCSVESSIGARIFNSKHQQGYC